MRLCRLTRTSKFARERRINMFTIWLVCFIAAELGYLVYCLMKAPDGVTLICGMCFIAIFFGFVFAQASAWV